MRRSPLLAIFMVVFINSLGFGLILPLLPLYAEEMGASEIEIGLLLMTFALAQFFGAPILGSLSDRYGRRPLLLISQLGSVVGYALLGAAWAVWVLLLARLIGGAMGGNITVAQAYISDVTDEKNRARGLGLIGAAFGSAFILGPAFGGFLSRWGYAVPAYAAALIAVGLFVFTAFTLPEPEQRQTAAAHGPDQMLSALVTISLRPHLRRIYLTGFMGALALVFFQATFALYAERRYDFGGLEIGLLLAYAGVLTVIVQVGLMGRLVALFGEWRLALAGAISLAAALVTMGLAEAWPLLLVAFVFLATGPALLTPNLQSMLTRLSGDGERGQVLGVFTSLDSLTRILAPIPATWLLGAVTPGAPLLLGGALAGIAALASLTIDRGGL